MMSTDRDNVLEQQRPAYNALSPKRSAPMNAHVKDVEIEANPVVRNLKHPVPYSKDHRRSLTLPTDTTTIRLQALWNFGPTVRIAIMR
ncbi:hypothetical protein PV08_07964 [Exophiala spinifera]|uniref:Uncharacterized protein n=1 Tax=Exophiala spinifera TaxID=91928 RepID=A0A0D1ZIU0_9EURO|nr:uncharacterized protein PV08_07964 [Exophiala spinifera]KIW12777.1 hypothetical protein PV08_07964 [Exophiala spinifera]